MNYPSVKIYFLRKPIIGLCIYLCGKPRIHRAPQASVNNQPKILMTTPTTQTLCHVFPQTTQLAKV